MSSDFKGKNVLVVGAGMSGIAAAKFLARKGATVTLNDRKPLSQLKDVKKMLDKFGVRIESGAHASKLFNDIDLIVPSPGIPWIAGLKNAKRKKTPILGELELASRFIKTPIVAITGTNGKTTTTQLTYTLIKDSGKKTGLGGNIGRPLINLAENNKKLDWIVAEVSSYQLETIEVFRPKIGIILNITPDHLDRYSGMGEYTKAKERLWLNQTGKDWLIYNKDDPIVRRIAKRAQSKLLSFSLSDKKASIFSDGKEIVVRLNGRVERYRLSRAKLVGLHNVQNMMASIAAARLCGVKKNSIMKTISRFKGLPHRMQWVRTKNCVRYFDDSKGTNVDAVVKSLAGFHGKIVHLLAGGLDKGGSYVSLIPVLKKNVKFLYVFGQAKKKMKKALGKAVTTIVFDNMKQSIAKAFRNAVKGDVVLLSPACASFDQFKNYADRGKKFKQWVKML